MKFLHTADLHIDSPLQSLEAYEGAPVEQVRTATRGAFANVVQLALDESVDFVVIAGDLFDGDWKDMQTGLWANGQFRRLHEAGIPVYLIRGNHDADSEITRRLSLPANVREFDVAAAQTFVDERIGVALHGRGFATRSVDFDLTEDYPRAHRDLFNIGVLHTSLAGDPQHDPYAPTSVERLADSRYDYWALGHVHTHRIISSDPWIVYPGNVQGRMFRECGPKGCVVVTAETGGPCDVRFHETDVARWHDVPLTLGEAHDLDDLRELLRQRLTQRMDESGGRPLVCRVVVGGACRLHRPLQERSYVERVRGEMQNVANSIGDCWLGQIRFETRPLVDVDALRHGNDLLGELLRDFSELATGTDAGLSSLTGGFDSLVSKAKAGSCDWLEASGVSMHDPEQIRRWLQIAEGRIVSLLQETNSTDSDAALASSEEETE